MKVTPPKTWRLIVNHRNYVTKSTGAQALTGFNDADLVGRSLFSIFHYEENDCTNNPLNQNHRGESKGHIKAYCAYAPPTAFRLRARPRHYSTPRSEKILYLTKVTSTPCM